jgi:hypothetical protein
MHLISVARIARPLQRLPFFDLFINYLRAFFDVESRTDKHLHMQTSPPHGIESRRNPGSAMPFGGLGPDVPRMN